MREVFLTIYVDTKGGFTPVSTRLLLREVMKQHLPELYFKKTGYDNQLTVGRLLFGTPEFKGVLGIYPNNDGKVEVWLESMRAVMFSDLKTLKEAVIAAANKALELGERDETPVWSVEYHPDDA